MRNLFFIIKHIIILNASIFFFNNLYSQKISKSDKLNSYCDPGFLKKSLLAGLTESELDITTKIHWSQIYMSYSFSEGLNKEMGKRSALGYLSKKKPKFDDIIKSYDSLIYRIENTKPNKFTLSLFESYYCYCVSSKDLVNDFIYLTNNIPLDSMGSILNKFIKCYKDEISRNTIYAKNIGSELTRIRDLKNYYSLQNKLDDLLLKKNTKEETNSDLVDDKGMLTQGNFRDKLLKKCTANFISKYHINSDSIKIKIENYCDCMIEKIANNNYTNDEDRAEFDDINSPQYNEVILMCNQELNSEYPINSKKDIIGNIDSTTLPFIYSIGNGYKVKISINGISKYFLFDTGATDVLIDTKTERELQSLGKIKKEDYLDNNSYLAANNEIMIAKTLLIDNFKIGDYIVNKVKVAVSDNVELLCGKSLIGKFSSFKINEKSKTIVLFK